MNDSPSNNSNNESSSRAGAESGSDRLIGTVFDRRYQILSLFGAGATGNVYKAEDLSLQRLVALKVIHSHLMSNANAIERFKNESATNIALTHENIARVYSQGIDDAGRLYIVMDCLEGRSLAELLADGGKLELDNFFYIFMQIIDALEYASSQGIVHRDIKPSNIVLVDDSGGKPRAMLVDFGLAKLIDQNNEQGVTQTGVLLGSSAYMSPEQCRGSKDIDARSDIYSLGCVMFQSLLGKSPFQGESQFDVMYKHLNESLKDLGALTTLPDSLSNMIRKCLQKEPNSRYKNFSDLKADFAKCSDMRDTLKRRWQQQQQQAGSKRNYFKIAVIFLVPGIIAAGFFAINWRKTQTTEIEKNIGKKVPLPSIEKAVLPQTEPQLGESLERYKKAGYGSDSIIKLLERWPQHHRTATEEQRLNAWHYIEAEYATVHNYKKAQEYGDLILKSGLSKPSFQSAETLSSMYRNANQPRLGLALLQQVLKRYSADKIGPDDYVQNLGEQGECYLALGDYENAYKTFSAQIDYVRSIASELDEIKQNGMNHWRLRLILSMVKTGRKKASEAIAEECLEAARRVEDKDNRIVSITYFNLGQTYKNCGDSEQAMRMFELCRQAADKLGDIGFAQSAVNDEIAVAQGRMDVKRARELSKSALRYDRDTMLHAGRLSQIVEFSILMNDIVAARNYAGQAAECCNKFLASADSDLCSNSDLFFVSAVNAMRSAVAKTKDTAEGDKVIDEWIQKVVARDPQSLAHASLLSYKAGILHAEGRDSEALAIVEKQIAILKNPFVRRRIEANKLSCDQKLSRAYCSKIFFLESMSRYSEAIDTGVSALKELANKKFESTDLSNIMLRIVYDLTELGRKNETGKYMDEIEKSWNRAFTAWNFDAADILYSLAMYYESIKDFKNAERILKQCLAGLESVYGNDDNRLRVYFSLLAKVKDAQQQYVKATDYILRSIEISKVNKLTDLEYFRALQILWQICMDQKDYERAENVMKQFIKNSNDCPHLAEGYYLLSNTYNLAGKPVNRLETVKRGLQVIKGTKKPLPVNISAFERELSGIYLQMNDPSPALSYAQSSVEESAKIPDLPQRDIESGHNHLQLARVQIKLGNYTAAASSFKTCTSLFEKLGKKYQPDLNSALNEWRIAAKDASMTKDAEALQARMEALQARIEAPQKK